MRYKLVFSYDGAPYEGYQIQKDKLTVAKVLNEAISKVLKVEINVTASGRTDSGVSAIAQVGHFDYDGDLPRNFVGHVNHELPSTIKICCVEAKPDFHARYDAKSKTYSYKFYVSDVANAYYDKFAYHVYNCDVKKMEDATKYLIGTHDFSSFCATGTAVKDKVRTITSATIIGDGNLYTFKITGNGFLYNMVRIIVGTLVQIGTTDLPAMHMRYIINTRDRKNAGPTLPASPLVLESVDYS